MSTIYLEKQSKANDNDFNKKPEKVISQLDKNEIEGKNLVKNAHFHKEKNAGSNNESKETKENSNLNKNENSKENEINSLIEGTPLEDYYKLGEWLKTGGSGYVFRLLV